MKKKRILKARLPMEMVEILRHKGGPQSTRRGGRGYDRKNKSWKKDF